MTLKIAWNECNITLGTLYYTQHLANIIIKLAVQFIEPLYKLRLSRCLFSVDLVNN